MAKRPTSKEIIATLRTKFPKFSKVTLCMVRNPAYGCALSEEAARTLQEIYPNYKVAQKPSSCVKPSKRRSVSNRKKAHRLTVRLDDEAYTKFEAALKKTSATSTQAFLEKVLEEYYDS